MKRTMTYTLAALLLLGSPVVADEGKGLFFAAGAGVAMTHTRFDTLDADWTSKEAQTHVGAAAAFKLGYGFNDRFDLYLTRTSAFVHGYDNDSKNRTYGNCITAIGANYAPYEATPWYLMAAVGRGQLSDLGEEEAKAKKGWGYLVGVGYEAIKHVHLEAAYMGTRVDDGDYKLQSDVLHVSVSLYLY